MVASSAQLCMASAAFGHESVFGADAGQRPATSRLRRSASLASRPHMMSQS